MKREEARKKAEALVAQMTLEEKASQLKYDAPAIKRLGIPAYNWWNEGVHGVARGGQATVFPQAIGLGATFDTELVEKIGDTISTEGRAKYNALSARGDRDIYKGLTYWAPNINIFRDPRWGRGHETYGEDPFLTSRMGVAYVKGLQGQGDTMKAAACAKHFAVHSGPEAVRHEFNAEVSAKDLYETYLPAFRALVQEAKVEAVMGAYNRVNGEVCCGSPTLQKILRKDWGFKGHFVSDCWAISDFHENHRVTVTAKESAALAINNGCDLNCGCTYLQVMKAYQDGLVTEETITESAVRLFTTRYLLGLFEGSEYDGIPYTEIESPAHLRLAEQAACESMVLLKNNDILPLDKTKLKTVGVIGPNADSRRALMGNYHGTASRYWTIQEGIQEYLGEEVRVLTSVGSGLFQDRKESLAFPGDRLSESCAVAENSDVVILCLGLDETLEGEQGDTGNSDASGDKRDLLLPESQRELMEVIARTGKPVVLCMMSGSDIDLSFAREHFDAILQLWYPGSEGGKAAAKILFGEVSPSGKLPVTFYESLDELPPFEDYSMKGRTYRYMEGKAQYPFGYGLTYGNVRVADAWMEPVCGNAASVGEPVCENAASIGKAVCENAASVGEPDMGNGGSTAGTAASVGAAKPYAMMITAEVENAGARATSEVVQVYVKPDSPDAPRNPSLCAFARVFLEPGEKKTVELPISEAAFQVMDKNGICRADGREFLFYVGVSQPDEKSRELTRTEPVNIMVSR